MSDLDTFTQLPIRLDPKTKALSSLSPGSSRALDAELATLNQLHRSILALETPHQVPPPPIPVNPKRSANVSKLRDSGNSEFRKGRYAEAVKLEEAREWVGKGLEMEGEENELVALLKEIDVKLAKEASAES
ncbi:tetratricopeptide repeat domain-containing protein [Magnaporthiopsis poae ATCC 64411]|uniref:Tetratricopeptide repeat domain-containing protein n=1 Tax=Magnaporthiopsis poae (strain ATCC 64411 / 73-15) TaxID=644358 RepID=A0A0C4DXG6_MAGP6|nr:tetratricopeptide repeat domain-containing protein [Magnaporthiopsis poae ATCC 64411]